MSMEGLKSVLEQHDGHNPFIPTETQLLQLEQNPLLSSYSGKSLYQWHQAINPQVIFGEDQLLLNNQLDRANILVTLLLCLPIRPVKIVILDGHGRFLWALTESLKRAGILESEFQLIVVDNDLVVHRWHERFFPRNVKKVYNDIYDFLRRIPINERESYLPYLNFCGLSGSYNELISLCQDWSQSGNRILFSHCSRSPLRSNRKKGMPQFLRQLNKSKTINELPELCRNGKFRTWISSPA